MVAWFIGAWKFLLPFITKFSLSKFLTGILTLVSAIWAMSRDAIIRIWRLWVQPYIDMIIAFIFVSCLEKIPGIGKKIRRFRIIFKWKTKWIWRKREEIIYKKIERPIKKAGQKLEEKIIKQQKGDDEN